MASGMAGKMDDLVSGLGQKVLELSQDKWMKLALSILIDLIGILSYIIPVVSVFLSLFHSMCKHTSSAVRESVEEMQFVSTASMKDLT